MKKKFIAKPIIASQQYSDIDKSDISKIVKDLRRWGNSVVVRNGGIKLMSPDRDMCKFARIEDVLNLISNKGIDLKNLINEDVSEAAEYFYDAIGDCGDVAYAHYSSGLSEFKEAISKLTDKYLT